MNILKRTTIVFTLIFILFQINVFSQNKRPDNWAIPVKTQMLSNFYKINDSLYRSKQPDNNGFKLIDSLKIRSVLSLRSKHKDDKLIGNIDLKLFNVEMNPENFSDKEIINALKIIKNSPKPLLIHCMHGSDRTGIVVALYRIIYNGWTKEQALDELKNGNYNFHEVYVNIPQYIKNVNIEQIKSQLK